MKMDDPAALTRLTALQQAVLACDAVLCRGGTQADIFNAVCRSLVDTAGFAQVWIGLCDTGETRIWPQAHAGSDDRDWAQRLPQLQSTPLYALASQAIAQGQAQCSAGWPADPSLAGSGAADAAPSTGGLEAMALPLRRGESVSGVVCVAAHPPQALDAVARAVLQQLADNLSCLLTRMAHDEAFKQSEFALKESEGRYDALFTSNCMPLLVIDPAEGRIVDANIRAVDYYGWDRPTLVGMRLADIEVPDAALARAQEARAGAVTHPYVESLHRLRSGEVRNVKVFHSALSFEGQNHIVLAIHDVTEPRRLAAELQRSQSLMQHFIDQLPGTAFLKDDQGRMVMANRRLCDMLGVEAAALVGKTVHDFFPKDFADELTQLDQHVLADGVAKVFPEIFQGRHNETNLFRVEDDGGARYLGGVSFDVTERERARARSSVQLRILELARRQLPEREFLTAGLELAQEITGSAIGFMHFVNDDQQTLELVTWTAGALKNCSATYDQHYPINQAGVWADSVRQREPVLINDYAAYTHKHGLPDGHAPLTRLVSVPVVEGGKVRMVLGVGNRDSAYGTFEVDTLQLIGNDLWRIACRVRLEKAVTERVHQLEQANEQLRTMQLQLVQSEKMASIGQLAAGVAHEINNPVGFIKSNLGTLKGYLASLQDVLNAYAALHQAEPSTLAGRMARIAQQKSELDYAFIIEDVDKLIQESIDGVQRVSKIVQDLKSFSRSGETTRAAADLEAGIESTLNMVWNQLKYKVELRREYQPLPPVVCIASQINQVIMNLLMNAGQAIAERGVITVRTGLEDDRVWFEVQDSGCGMDAATQQKIFEPFYTTKPVGQGTGLGLPISLSIVQRHHGRIDVRSAPGQGSTFRVTLPLAGVKG